MPAESVPSPRVNRPGRSDQPWWLAFPLLAGLGVSLLGLLFLHLGSEVAEGETRAFDSYFLHGAQSLRAAYPWLADVMRDLSGVGSTVSLTLLTLGSSGYLALARSRAEAAIVALSVGSAAMTVQLLKSGFGRARPDAAYSQFAASGLSFPSGHTSMSAVVFLTLGVLLSRRLTQARERRYVMGFAALLTILVGVSRATLGVHWATDVLGGWAFGSAWAVVWLLIAERLDPRRG